MKKIIDGVMYDTDSAVKIGTLDNYDPDYMGRVKETLYLTHKLYPARKRKIKYTNGTVGDIEYKDEYGNLFIHAKGGVLTEYSKLGLNEDGECDRVAGEKISLIRWSADIHKFGIPELLNWLEKLDGDDAEKALVRLGYMKHGVNKAGKEKAWVYADPITDKLLKDEECDISISGGSTYSDHKYGNAPKFKVRIA